MPIQPQKRKLNVRQLQRVADVRVQVGWGATSFPVRLLGILLLLAGA